MTIPEILKALESDAVEFPREALEAAIQQREAITPELLSIIEKAAEKPESVSKWACFRDHSEDDLPFFAPPLERDALLPPEPYVRSLDRPQRPLPMRQRQKVQEVLWEVTAGPISLPCPA